MKTTFTIVLTCLLFCGCSPKQTTPAGTAVDVIETGSETTWSDGAVALHVTERDDATLRGVEIKEKRADGLKLTYTADVATVSPGKVEDPNADDYVTIVIHDAKVEAVRPSGEKVSNIEDVTLTLRK